MKSYEERISEIDKAIENLDGQWLYDGFYMYKTRAGSYISVDYFDPSFDKDNSYRYIGTVDEFNQRALELGYINGYKWGVEYETNGKKPDLPDDVVVEFRSIGIKGIVIDGWLGSETVAYWVWPTSDKFRIVDERYKPKSQSVSEIPESNSNLENVSENWRGRGYPPVDSVINYWYCRGREYSGVCQIRGYHGWEVWCKTIEGENHFGTKNFVITIDCQFTPIPEKYDLVIYNPFSIAYEGLTKEEASAKIQAIQDLAKDSNKPNLLVTWKLYDVRGNSVVIGE